MPEQVLSLPQRRQGGGPSARTHGDEPTETAQVDDGGKPLPVRTGMNRTSRSLEKSCSTPLPVRTGMNRPRSGKSTNTAASTRTHGDEPGDVVTFVATNGPSTRTHGDDPVNNHKVINDSDPLPVRTGMNQA